MADMITVGGYISLLVVIFLLPPAVILLARRLNWSERINMRALLLRAPLKGRMKSLLLQNVELSQRPLNQQLDTFLYSRTNYGLGIDLVQAALSLVSCGLVLYSSTFPFTEPDPDWAVAIEVALSCYFAADYSLRFFLAQDRLSFYFSPVALLDYVTIVPGLLNVVLNAQNLDANAFIVSQTLRVFRIFRVVRLLRIVALSTSSSLTRQFMVLGVTVLSMVFAAAAIFQILDSTPDRFIPFHHAVLYMTITIIGRPPVPTNTDSAKIMETVTIFLGAFIIPAFTVELARLYFEQQGREVYASDASVPHVILCGDVNPSRLRAFLAQFFHKSRDPEQLSPLVVLSEQKYEGPLKTLIEQSRYVGSVTYLRGSARKPADLKRAAAHNASTVIVLCHGRDVDAGTADSEIVCTCLALKNINRRVRVLTQLRRPRSRDHLMCLPGWRDADRAVAISSLSMTLLGVGSLLPGLPTLLTNLVHQGNKMNARSSNPRRRKTVNKHGSRGALQGQAAGMIVASSSPWWAAPLMALVDVIETAGTTVTSSLARSHEGDSEEAEKAAAANAHEMLEQLLRPLSPVEEYTSGFAQEMFAFAVTPGFSGRTFAVCARAAYLRYGVLLIGARVPVGEEGGGAEERAYSVMLFPADLTLRPGMYLHAIAFDALDLAGLLTATGGLDMAVKLASMAEGGGLGEGKAGMHKSSSVHVNLHEIMGRGKAAKGDGWTHNRGALRDLSVPWCFSENEEERAAAVLTALDSSGYSWMHTPSGKAGLLPPGLQLHKCACEAHMVWAEKCKSAVQGGAYASLQTMLHGPMAHSHSHGSSAGVGSSSHGFSAARGAGAFAFPVPFPVAVPRTASVGPSGTHGPASSGTGTLGMAFTSPAQKGQDIGVGGQAAGGSQRKPGRIRLNSEALEGLLFDDDADGLGLGRSPAGRIGLGGGGVGVGASARPVGAGGRAPVAPLSTSTGLNAQPQSSALGILRTSSIPRYGERGSGNAFTSRMGEMGGTGMDEVSMGGPLDDLLEDDEIEDEGDLDDEDDLDPWGMGAEEDDAALSEGGPTDGENSVGGLGRAGGGYVMSRQSSSRNIRTSSFTQARTSAGQSGAGNSDLPSADSMEGGATWARDVGMIQRSRSRHQGSQGGVGHQGGRGSGAARSRTASGEGTGSSAEAVVRGQSLNLRQAMHPATLMLAQAMQPPRGTLGGTASLFSVRGILARAAANPALVPAFFRVRRHMQHLAAAARRGLPLSPYRDHILVCGMSDSIGLLLRSLQTPPPAPPRAQATHGLAALLSEQVGLFVERRAMALVAHGHRHGAVNSNAGKATGGKAATPAEKAAAAAAAIPMHLRHLPIVVLCPPGERPTDAAVNAMHAGSSRWLARVTFVAGSPSDLGDLLRAGVETARAAVVLSTKRPQANPDGTDNLADDTDAIVVASAIYKLNPYLHILTEVVHGPHASYLRPLGSTLQDAEESSAIAATRKQQEEARQRYEARQRRAADAAVRRAETGAAKAKATAVAGTGAPSPSSIPIPAPIPISPVPLVGVGVNQVVGGGTGRPHSGVDIGLPPRPPALALAAALPIPSTSSPMDNDSRDARTPPHRQGAQSADTALSSSLLLDSPRGPALPSLSSAQGASTHVQPGSDRDNEGLARIGGLGSDMPLSQRFALAGASGQLDTDSPGVDGTPMSNHGARDTGLVPDGSNVGNRDDRAWDADSASGEHSSTSNTVGHGAQDSTNAAGSIASRLARERIRLALTSGDTIGRATLAGPPKRRMRPALSSVFARPVDEEKLAEATGGEGEGEGSLDGSDEEVTPTIVRDGVPGTDSVGALSSVDSATDIRTNDGHREGLSGRPDDSAGEGDGVVLLASSHTNAADAIGLDLSFDGLPSGSATFDPWAARGGVATAPGLLSSVTPAAVTASPRLAGVIAADTRSRAPSMSSRQGSGGLGGVIASAAAALGRSPAPQLAAVGSPVLGPDLPSLRLDDHFVTTASSHPAPIPSGRRATPLPVGSTLAGYAMDQSVAIAAAAEAAARDNAGPAFVGPPTKMAAPSDIFGAPAFAAGRAFSTTTLDALMCEAHFAPHILFIIKQLVRASRKQRLQLLPVADAVAMCLLVAPVGPGSALHTGSYMVSPPAAVVTQTAGPRATAGAAGGGMLTGSDWDDGLASTQPQTDAAKGKSTRPSAFSSSSSWPEPRDSVAVPMDAVPPMATTVVTGATAALLQAVHSATHGAAGVANNGAVSVPEMRTYGQLFEALVRGWHLLPVGLYRRVQPGATLHAPIVPDPVSHFVAAFATSAASAAAAAASQKSGPADGESAPPLSTAAAQMADIAKALGGNAYAGYTGSASFSHEKSLLSYVLTNPSPDTRLNSADFVYVLRPANEDDDDEF